MERPSPLPQYSLADAGFLLKNLHGCGILNLMDMQIVFAPLLGGAIGYLTNWLAIKMLFRPAKPVYIGRFRVPLTPGLIPKEKRRLAVSVGDAVGRELLSEASLRHALLSEAMIGKIEDALDGLVSRGLSDERTLYALYEGYVGAEKAEAGFREGKEALARFLSERLEAADLGAAAASAASDSLRKKEKLHDILSGILDERIKNGVREQIQNAVNGYVKRYAADAARAAVESEGEKLARTRLCDLARDNQPRIADLRKRLMSLYAQAVEGSLNKALSALDVAGIVRERIEGIDDRELEGMILAVVDKELKAIVYLGALLGFLMGFLTLLF